MTPLGRFTLRLAIYGSALAYVAADLFVFRGPLKQTLERRDPHSAVSVAEARAAGVVARVFQHTITMGQLDAAVAERLRTQGRRPQDLSPALLRMVRYAALQDLIDHELLRVKAKAHAETLRVDPAEIDARIQRLEQRFGSREALETSLKEESPPGIEGLRGRIAARIQQERYVESRIAPLSVVTKEEAREWFGNHAAELSLPERVELRHVFVATLERPAREARAILETALADSEAGRSDFATLAATLSEDPASKNRGGSLGWMTRKRLPEDLADAVFALPIGKPTLLQSRTGWHLMEVTARKPAGPRSFEQAEAEVMAALSAQRRLRAVRDFRDALRRLETERVTIDHQMLNP